MTLLATGTGEEIVNRIEGERISKKWKYGTTLTYVEAILSAGTTTPEAHKRLLRYRKALKGHARAESRTAAPAFTATMAQRLHPAESELELAILLSFTYGQRISDMVQLASEDVGPMGRAKTIRATGPYTLRAYFLWWLCTSETHKSKRYISLTTDIPTFSPNSRQPGVRKW